MLTKMPKVGDVLIANEKAVGVFRRMTAGKYYEVLQSDVGPYGIIKDNTGWCIRITEHHFEYFTLKGAEPVGYVFIDSQRGSGVGERYSEIRLTVDDVGLHAVKKLAEASSKQRKKTGLQERLASLQSQIDALQKELDAI